jgi:hypothetical protein
MEEFSNADLGDERLNKRLIKLCNSLSESPESPINQACGDWAETKAAYRFFRNDTVSASQIMCAHAAKTAERIRGHKIVLAIQDTTCVMYTEHLATTGLGNLSVKKGRRVDRIYSKGLLMHSCLAVTTSGLPLGLLDQKIIARTPQVGKRSTAELNKIPIENNESFRWLESLRASKALTDVQVVTICDREADMYEFLLLSSQIDAPVLVRADTNRAVNKRSMYTLDPAVKLWEFMKGQKISGSFEVEVPLRKKTKHATAREARTALVTLKFGSFNLNPPKKLSSKLPDIAMQAVYVYETDPPDDVEPLEWMLLTNFPVETFEQAYEKVKWYCLRWRIEMFHKVLKSGFNIEACRLSDANRLIRYLTVMSVIAWRLFMVTLIARTDPQLPCTTVLGNVEWQVLSLKVKKGTRSQKTVPTVGEAVVWIAQLGGFLARKNDGYPGIITLWRGWKRLADLAEGFNLVSLSATCG